LGRRPSSRAEPTSGRGTTATINARRVLIIEDEPDGRDALCALLQSWGHEVDGAGTADEALSRSAAFHPDVVLLDLTLDGAPDCDLIRRLRRYVGPTVQLVVYSGHAELERTARAAGCDAYVVKPGVEALERLLG
jgi:CheY-like chemotaxis protein